MKGFCGLSSIILSLTSPAAALSCGQKPAMEIYDIIANATSLEPKSVAQAAQITARQILNSYDVIVEARITGVKCTASGRAALINLADVKWLKVPPGIPSAKASATAYWDTWPDCREGDVDKNLAHNKTVRLFAGRFPFSPSDPDRSFENADFYVPLCEYQLFGDLDLLADRVKQRGRGGNGPQITANYETLKKELEAQIDRLRLLQAPFVKP
jgi:hypothetical protein